MEKITITESKLSFTLDRVAVDALQKKQAAVERRQLAEPETNSLRGKTQTETF